MADDIDRATEQAQYLLDVALFKHRRIPTSLVSSQFCEDCDDPIPSHAVLPLLAARRVFTVSRCGSSVDE